MKPYQVSDIMAKSPVTLGRNDALDRALDLMETHGIRHIPVLEQGALVGILSQRDLFHATLGSVLRYGERAERAFLATLLVKEVMTEPPLTTIGPGASLREAARLLAEQKIGCLPVLKDGELVGLLTKTDVLRTVAAVES